MKWRNVKDKLPKEDELGVLIYGKLEVGHFYAMAMWYKGKFIDVDNPGQRKNITHWMPLPHLPKD